LLDQHAETVDAARRAATLAPVQEGLGRLAVAQVVADAALVDDGVRPWDPAALEAERGGVDQQIEGSQALQLLPVEDQRLTLGKALRQPFGVFARAIGDHQLGRLFIAQRAQNALGRTARTQITTRLPLIGTWWRPTSRE
jgi:hypothetical protein